MKYDTLIIEGGGFKTAFTAGILDAFMMAKYKPFKTIIGISGGSIAMSYYLSGQYRFCIKAMRLLAKDEQFADFKRTFGEKGYLDIDYLSTIASDKIPFDLDAAVKATKKINAFMIATDRKDGVPVYLQANKKQWIQMVIASSTLPFTTKGIHKLNGKSLFDGGWGNPLPVNWAYENGAKNILVLRTQPKKHRDTQSWVNYFGSLYYGSEPKLKKLFETVALKYNRSIEFMENPPNGVHVKQLDPKKFLKSGTYSYNTKTLMLDYRYGLDRGLNHLSKL